ncbi:hypothetical protein [Kocuria flava]|nr:hypothetical protein [Kocuria flava]
MDPWLTPLITLLAATVGGLASYFGSRHSKRVDQQIAKDQIEFDYRQKRVEYKMRVFGEYISLMQEFADITDKRWTLGGSPNEWKLDLQRILARLDKSPAMLFLHDDEVKVLGDYSDNVTRLAFTYLSKLEWDHKSLMKVLEENVSDIVPKIIDAGVELDSDESMEIVAEMLTEIQTKKIWPELDEAQTAVRDVEGHVKEVLRRNLQSDLS